MKTDEKDNQKSFNDSVRNQCSRVLLSFLLNYPMSNNRVEKLLAFWELYTGSKRQSFNSSCSRCIYSLVSDVAKIYFEYKQSDGKKKQNSKPAS